MNYDESLEYLESLNKRGIHPGLEGIKGLLAALNNPERARQYIHVAGTNGKGSTALYISRILRAAGKKVGVYASPAVFDVREIVSVNGRSVSKADYARLVSMVSAANTMGCTRFEVETAMAFIYFKEKECDYVVLEAGMGGLLDATNVIEDKVACVFTAIGLDHTSYLGDTIGKIAENKAGIIKPGSLVVTTKQEPEAFEAIKKRASECNCTFIESDYTEAKDIKYRLTGTKFSYKNLKNLETSLLGTYQVQNAVLAADVAKALSLDDKCIKKGIAEASESGRFEVVSKKPLIILDGAHNEPASLRLRETLKTYFTNKKFIYIMGMLKDKDVETVVKNTVDLASCIFTVATPNKARTMSSFELAEVIKPYNSMVSSLDSIEEAVEMASMVAASDKDAVVVVFGSLSHLGGVKKAVQNLKNIKADAHGVI